MELSNGVQGIVVENYEALCSRPRVRVIADGGVTDEYIDLAHDSAMLNVTVQSVGNVAESCGEDTAKTKSKAYMGFYVRCPPVCGLFVAEAFL